MLGILVLASTLFISSDIASNSYALDGTNLNSEVTAEIDGTHYVTLSASDVTFSITPTNGTASDKKQVNVDLSANVSGGASLYLSTSSSKNALYLNGDTNSTNQNIASASSTTTYDNMVNNTWAYSTDDINYQGIPTLDSPVLLSDIDGISTGTNTNGVVSATIPIYYAAKVDTSIPSGSYANSVTYSAVVDGGIVTSATLTKITVDNQEVEELQAGKTNVILVTTNLKTNPYGTPRVYYETTDPSGYAECGDVVVSSNEAGYMTVQCNATPAQAATGVTLHVVPKGSTSDVFCTDGTYPANSSQCEKGEWRWGEFTVALPNIKAPIFGGIRIMQEMTPQICADAQENDTTRLEDARDGKMYWVAKLADGNCWMTQNLALDLNGRTLTPVDSDVSNDWNFNDAVANAGSGGWYTSSSQGDKSTSAIQGWNLGEYVKTDPTDTKYCPSNGSLGDFNECPGQFTQVTSNMTPYDEDINGVKAPDDNVAVDGNNYDAHYLVGNFYSGPAVTAGSGNVVSSSGNATDSICPANWRLPAYSGNGSHRNLLSPYGLTSSTTSGNNNIATSPLYFVRSGYVSVDFGGLNFAGEQGSYWSSMSDGVGQLLFFHSSSVDYEDTFYGVYNGMPVRCVAPSA